MILWTSDPVQYPDPQSLSFLFYSSIDLEFLTSFYRPWSAWCITYGVIIMRYEAPCLIIGVGLKEKIMLGNLDLVITARFLNRRGYLPAVKVCRNQYGPQQ